MGPLVGFRAPGWSTNELVYKILVNLNYRIDASRVVDRSFLSLKLIHQLLAAKRTQIYRSYWNLLFKYKVSSNKDLDHLLLKTVCGLPFYHSVFKLLPIRVCKFLIMISKLTDIESYIFHARDFQSCNLQKTRMLISLLEEFYVLNSVRDIKNGNLLDDIKDPRLYKPELKFDEINSK